MPVGPNTPYSLSKSSVLSFEDARHCVESHAHRFRQPATEVISLLASCGRVLAEPITADRHFPPFDRATRDGYAVRADDLTGLPRRLEIIGEVKAGAEAENFPNLRSGQAVAIMTGAAIPRGADAVVMIEYSRRIGSEVEIEREVSAGENVVATGSEARSGVQVLAPGIALDYASIAVAASVGKSQVRVFTKPRVAILSTGDEIVDITAVPKPAQIRNSNSYSLAVQIQAAGGDPVILPIAPDEPSRLRALIAQGFEADLLLIAGGVSMGKYDLVEDVVADTGAEFFFTGVKIQPGKPLVFGRSTGKGKYFFGLPGNPVSTMVTFELFVRPVLQRLAGATLQSLRFLNARLGSDVQFKTGLTRFLPAKLSGEFQQGEVRLVPWQGSGDIAATAAANCYIVVPPDREKLAAGEWVSVMMR